MYVGIIQFTVKISLTCQLIFFNILSLVTCPDTVKCTTEPFITRTTSGKIAKQTVKVDAAFTVRLNLNLCIAH